MAATISGIVFNDLNHNGQYDPGEPGISDIFLVLSGSAGCVPMQTDADGGYSFSITAAGTYVVYETVAPPGSACPPAVFTQPSGFTMSNGPRKLTARVTAAQISGGAAIKGQNFSHDATNAPMDCGTSMIQFVAHPSKWYNINISTGASTFYTVVNPAHDVNAIGYNILDNYIYGYDQTTGSIVRVDNAGNLLTLRPSPAGLPADDFNTGTFEPAGFFYLFRNDTARFYTVDLRPNSPTFMKLVNPAAGYSEQTSDYGTALSKAINVSDWVYNTADSFLYGIERNGVVERIAPTTGAVTSLTTTGPNPAASFGAVAIDGDGNIYAISNGDGSIYRYVIDGNTANGVYFSTTFFDSFNDGTMCPTAVLKLDYGDAPDLGPSNGEGNYNTLLANNGPRHELVNELYLGTAVTSEPDALQNADATGDDLALGIQDDGPAVPLPLLHVGAGEYSLEVTVTNGSGLPANLYGWVDFNRNGLFELTEAAPVQIIPPLPGAQTTTLLFAVPPKTELSPGHTFARLRLTTAELAAQEPPSQQDSRSVGSAPDGEVEDYVLAIDAAADLVLKKTVDRAAAKIGDQPVYTITITNNGPSPANNVSLTDITVAGIADVNFSVDGGITWQSWASPLNLGTLANGGNLAVLLRGTVTDEVGGTLENTASVSGDEFDPVPDNNTDTVKIPVGGLADLWITKSACPNIICPCGVITYILGVANLGPDAANDVILSDALPAGIRGARYSVDGGKTWRTWSGTLPLGDMTQNATATVLIRGCVCGHTCGTLCNTASVSSSTADPNPDNNHDTAITPILPPCCRASSAQDEASSAYEF